MVGVADTSVRSESVWLTQKLIAERFQIGVGTVNHHLKAIYDEAELASEATIRRYRIVRTEGTREVTRDIEHYNLQAILAVGYRVLRKHGYPLDKQEEATKIVLQQAELLSAGWTEAL
ncbi:MAG: virulence RhuM family protein [Deltaproteobacteria bacterium]|nr:virulence RhuM family protein [Deltaproteobacteria bacterium]